jgi:hypothetical protein
MPHVVPATHRDFLQWGDLQASLHITAASKGWSFNVIFPRSLTHQNPALTPGFYGFEIGMEKRQDIRYHWWQKHVKPIGSRRFSFNQSSALHT